MPVSFRSAIDTPGIAEIARDDAAAFNGLVGTAFAVPGALPGSHGML